MISCNVTVAITWWKLNGNLFVNIDNRIRCFFSFSSLLAKNGTQLGIFNLFFPEISFLKISHFLFIRGIFWNSSSELLEYIFQHLYCLHTFAFRSVIWIIEHLIEKLIDSENIFAADISILISIPPPKNCKSPCPRISNNQVLHYFLIFFNFYLIIYLIWNLKETIKKLCKWRIHFLSIT